MHILVNVKTIEQIYSPILSLYYLYNLLGVLLYKKMKRFIIKHDLTIFNLVYLHVNHII